MFVHVCKIQYVQMKKKCGALINDELKSIIQTMIFIFKR